MSLETDKESLQIRLISSRGNFQASKSCRGLRRFPRFFKLIRLEFFVEEYLFEFHSGPRGYEETIWIFGMEYIFDTFQFLFGLVRDIYGVIRCFVTCTIHATIRAIAPIDRKWNDAVFVRRYPSEFDYSARSRN